MRKPVLSYGGILLAAALVPATASAVESSATVSARHPQCDAALWRHLERRAREDAERFCAERGGVDDESVRWVHHDSPYGGEQLCVVHLHYGCLGTLPGDERRS